MQFTRSRLNHLKSLFFFGGGVVAFFMTPYFKYTIPYERLSSSVSPWDGMNDWSRPVKGTLVDLPEIHGFYENETDSKKTLTATLWVY